MHLNGKTPGGRARWACREGGGSRTPCYSSTAPGPLARTQSGKLQAPAAALVFDRKLQGTRFLVTAAQNATPVHAGFWQSLHRAAKHRSAELVVLPIRYKNPTSRWSASQAGEENWSSELVPYLFNVRRKLNDNLVVLGDIKTQPTASDPLSGFEAITHGESGILGHTKMALRTIPTPAHRYPKLMTTTGACTVPNYTDTKAGKMGEFHHTLGAVMVELDGKQFHLRQINADKAGAFYDLDCLYEPDRVTRGHAAAGLVLGDTHVGFVDPKVERATFAGPGSVVRVLRPETLVFHDLHDGYGINPHHHGNVFNAIAKEQSGRGDARVEMLRAIDYVRARVPKTRKAIIVGSNHDDFLRRWIVSSDWRQDAENAEFYLETALAMVRGTKMTDTGTSYPGAFALWASKLLPPHCTVLGIDESTLVAGIEVGMHGDRGPNGARGSLKTLRRVGVRSVIGHSHTPGISEGAYQTGTSTHLRLEYNQGPSSWLNAHCVIYPNGKRSLLFIIDGKWRA
jgi:hypothetical protein